MDTDLQDAGNGKLPRHRASVGRPRTVQRRQPSRLHTVIRRAVKSERGASALEFGLVIPVLIFMLFGIVEFGVLFQNKLALTHAAREGARMAATGQWNETTVKSIAYPITPTVVVTPSPPSTAARGQAITVVLSYNYDWILLPFPGTMQIQGKAVMRRE